ncbi:TetR/AcrR family transcriptional regulator [Vibrio metschnikovii]|uniref:TetR/AcrR family transcriptional regulator n=1 Tax=Vibrio metschnikovii TaxID=28172 RepID=UPI001C2F4E4B|nr:TetR/AcrR family transcriptional regulator [Vibrio metschnikovii]
MKLSKNKRQALVESAKEEFFEHGYNNANMKRVCERASTSKRTLYKYFESKEVLFAETIKSFLYKRSPHVGLKYIPNECMERQLKDYLIARLDLLYNKIGLPIISMIIGEFISSRQLIRNYIALISSVDNELKVWLDELIIDKRLLHFDSSYAATLIINQFHGLFLWPQVIGRLEKPSTEQQELFINEIIRIFKCSYFYKATS